MPNSQAYFFIVSLLFFRGKQCSERTKMRRLALLLSAFLLLFSCAAAAEGLPDTLPLPSPEAPAPERTHTAPAETPLPPAVIDRTLGEDLTDTIRFRVDSVFFHIWFPNIDNADEAVLICGDEVWLLDAGDVRAGARGVELMKKLGVEKIDKIINSHPHHDHIGGLETTCAAFPVGELLICFPGDRNSHMATALSVARKYSVAVGTYGDGDTLTMGGGKVSLRFLLPRGETLDLNSLSAVTLVQCGDRRILFAADTERPGQEALLTQYAPEDLRAEILKYPHHGKSALVDGFWRAVSPSLAVVTNARAKCPDWAGIDFLDRKKIRTLFTNTVDSYCHLYTDGTAWVAEYVPMDAVPADWQ